MTDDAPWGGANAAPSRRMPSAPMASAAHVSGSSEQEVVNASRVVQSIRRRPRFLRRFRRVRPGCGRRVALRLVHRRRPRWRWASTIAQRGFNRDPICYPTNACFDEDPRPEISGYRWRYDVAAAAGPGAELSTGFIVRRARLELSFGHRRQGLDQMFLNVSDYNGVNLADRRDSTVVSDTQSSIDHLVVRTLAINAYYDSPAGSGFSPYLGIGAGPAFVTVAGVCFTDEYRDTAANGEVYLRSSPVVLQRPTRRRPVRHGPRRARARGRRLPRDRSDLAGAEAHLVDARRRRNQRRLRPAPGAGDGSRFLPPRHVRRYPLMVADVHRQARLPQLKPVPAHHPLAARPTSAGPRMRLRRLPAA